jgi:alpha-1,3-glucan synthase
MKDWLPEVGSKLTKLACMTIGGLDIDGIRIDKATQLTANFVMEQLIPGLRECARTYNKDNFFLPAEITTGINFGTRYIGKGRKMDNLPQTPEEIFSNHTLDLFADRKSPTSSGMDSAAFHYSIYRAYLRTAGLKGNLLAPHDMDSDFVEDWNILIRTMDYVNANTGKFDPRDMFAVTNQDTFRYPSLVDGERRLRLGIMLTTVALPGIPLLLYGDEQGFFLHDSRTENYIYGRQPMTNAEAWQIHGCYQGNASYQFIGMPFSEKSRNGCLDDSQSLDHFKYASDEFLYTQHMYQVRDLYPTLKDGFRSEIKKKVYLPDGSVLWSIERGYYAQQENYVSGKDVWILYTNSSVPLTFTGGCERKDDLFMVPFSNSGVFRDIFYPYGSITTSMVDGIPCVDSFELAPYGYRVLTATYNFVEPAPTITRVEPTHDQRIELTQSSSITVPVSFSFSREAPCDSILQHVKVTSYSGATPRFDTNSIRCSTLNTTSSPYGVPQGVMRWSATLTGVTEGVYQLEVERAVAFGNSTLFAPFKSMFRVGTKNNVIVFPKVANYSTTLLNYSDGRYQLRHTAVGANQFRYSLDFGKTWTRWSPYETTTNVAFPRSQYDRRVARVQYWCEACGSSAFVVHSEWNVTGNQPVQESKYFTFPSFHLLGEFNQYGNDGAYPISMKKVNGEWEFSLVWHFPTNVTLDVYLDAKFVYGDVDGDKVIDRLPPNAQDLNSIVLPVPPSGYTGWIIRVNDRSHRYYLIPIGSAFVATLYWGIIAFACPAFGCLAVYLFLTKFHKVKKNILGRKEADMSFGKNIYAPVPADEPKPTVLMATLEYEIPDIAKVRIGGLGVIGSCVATHFDMPIVWVVPMVGDIDYPPMQEIPGVPICIFGSNYSIRAYQHQHNNIKFILLDCEIFRQRTKKDPYPPKMDDLESGVFYSAWNQAIAYFIAAENVQVYHINDFHGALAPLHLLPETIPVVLSLHNAEFQGLWPLRTEQETSKVCALFNISEELCEKYVQYGNTFNLLHAATMYIRYHQNGEGAGGVSDLYGYRCQKRYPTLWALKKMALIQNPNPVDYLDPSEDKFVEDMDEEQFKEFKRSTQGWAGLEIDDSKTIFVFVGRWSRQKGIDVIADLTPMLMENYPNSQVICIGPVIDLYGKLAALKLAQVMEQYPTRVYSKPEFTQIPPFVFKGCDFVLLPSRDEPFGLVAVEFGRNGVLGIGSSTGGLGTMPGFWFPIESTETPHMLEQFKAAIEDALNAPEQEIRKMIVNAMNERFPVKEWKEKIFRQYKRAMELQNKNYQFSSTAVPRTKGTLFSLHRRNVSWSTVNTDSRNASLVNLSADGSFVNSSRKGSHLALSMFSRGGSDLNISGQLGRGERSQSGVILLRSTVIPNTSSTGIDESHSKSQPTQFYMHEDSSYSSFSTAHHDPSYPVGGETDHRYMAYQELTLEAIQKMEDFQVEDPFDQFLDEDGLLEASFIAGLKSLDIDSSQNSLCIELVIKNAERKFYSEAVQNRLSESLASTRSAIQRFSKVLCQRKFGDWPFYAVLLAFGQLISSSVFQIVLLSGSWSVTPELLNSIAISYFAGTCLWWFLYRMFPSFLVLSVPYLIYALSVFFLALPIHGSIETVLKVTAVTLYAFASGAGSLFFSLNFGEEAGVDMTTWIFRSGVVVGISQLWNFGLYFWAESFANSAFKTVDTTGPSIAISVVCFFFFAVFVFAFVVLFFGLPFCYRHQPAKIPLFYISLTWRRLAMWFLVAQFVQTFWLSGAIGRNYQFLWNQPISAFSILQMILFFVGLWCLVMYILYRLGRVYSWILPVFAVGLLSPLWAQMSWSCSTVGYTLHWAGTAAPYLSLALWLWLGVLVAIQSVGLSMMLLQVIDINVDLD